MRLSEKTVELNICAQINENLNQRLIWFGLTQAQEAIAGFDTAIRLKGKILLFQFKASNRILKSGARRFLLEHQQLQNLIQRINGRQRSVFYAFPLIGSTKELNNLKGDFYNNTWILDVSNLPRRIPPPSTKIHPIRLRASQKHYADVLPPSVIIHSDPIEAKLESLSSLIENEFYNTEGAIELFDYLFKSFKLFGPRIPLLKGFKMAVLIK